jgi:prolipoprotein diacylglyceryltransferase
VPEPASIHRAGTRVLSVILIVLGVVLLVSTIARDGGPLSVGVLFGLALGGAGAARLWLERARERG